LHLVRLSIMPIIYYKIMQVQSSAPHHADEEPEPQPGQ